MIKVKICGITNVLDALNAAKYGADALGFVFAKSSRHVSSRKALSIIKELPLFTFKVGVFVNAPAQDVLKVIRFCGLDAVQLHGEEDDRYCAFLRKYCRIIKTFRIKDENSMQNFVEYKNIDAYLFDTYTLDAYGGTGLSFDHKRLQNLRLKKPIIIAGGLNLKNVETVIQCLAPYAVDVSSGVEDAPGRKNADLLKSFILQIKKERP